MKCDRWDEARGRQDEDEGFRVTVNIGRSETTEETEEGHKGGHTECRVCVWGGAFLWETWWEHWSQVFIKSHNPSLSSLSPHEDQTCPSEAWKTLRDPVRELNSIHLTANRDERSLHLLQLQHSERTTFTLQYFYCTPCFQNTTEAKCTVHLQVDTLNYFINS